MKIDKATRREIRQTLRRIQQLANDQINNCCNEITPAQCATILEINDLDEATTGKLAESLGLDKSTLSRTIDKLVQKELVRRKDHPEDRRRIVLCLSPAGEEACCNIMDRSDQFIETVFENIPADQHRGIIEALNTLVDAMEKSCTDKPGDSCCS